MFFLLSYSNPSSWAVNMVKSAPFMVNPPKLDEQCNVIAEVYTLAIGSKYHEEVNECMWEVPPPEYAKDSKTKCRYYVSVQVKGSEAGRYHIGQIDPQRKMSKRASFGFNPAIDYKTNVSSVRLKTE
jgi:hypothetical protein